MDRNKNNTNKKIESSSFSDAHIFQISFVPVQLICSSTNKRLFGKIHYFHQHVIADLCEKDLLKKQQNLLMIRLDT